MKQIIENIGGKTRFFPLVVDCMVADLNVSLQSILMIEAYCFTGRLSYDIYAFRKYNIRKTL